MDSLSELMTEAQRLIGERPERAMQMMIEARRGRSSVPDAYDVILSRAACAAGSVDVACEHLARVLGDRPHSSGLRRAYAEALVISGNIIEAGEQLGLAVKNGAAINSLSMHLKMVFRDHLNRHPADQEFTTFLDLSIISEFGVLDEHHNVMLIYIPKVACTVLKATVIMNSPRRDDYLASTKTIHEFVGRDRNEEKLLSALVSPDVFRFAVVRDPAKRVLSAYLNKFVPNPPREPLDLALNKRYAIRVGQKLAGIDLDYARGITFEEFVNFLAQATDLELDAHWMPQSRIIGLDTRRYNHIGRFEELSSTFDMLKSRYGYEVERDSSVHLNGQKDHATKYTRDGRFENPSMALPADLRRLGQVYPSADAFLTPELHSILVSRFAADAVLHANAGVDQ